MKFYFAAAIAAAVSAEELFTLKTEFFEGFLKSAPTGNEPTDPCCHDCVEPFEKYHSVDHTFNNCGEACMDPKKFWIYKIFEPGLEKSTTNTPCADRNYTDYRNTPTHGVWPITMTLDLYGPTEELLTAEPIA